jgi:hypothetical protein
MPAHVFACGSARHVPPWMRGCTSTRSSNVTSSNARQ